MQIFLVSAQKSIKIRQWFWESFEVRQHLECDEIDDSSFDESIVKECENGIKTSKFKIFFIYTYVGYLYAFEP
jgi:hypothetical protein